MLGSSHLSSGAVTAVLLMADGPCRSFRLAASEQLPLDKLPAIGMECMPSDSSSDIQQVQQTLIDLLRIERFLGHAIAFLAHFFQAFGVLDDEEHLFCELLRRPTWH